MSEKRYFKVEYDEEWYLFDSNTISEELVTEQAEYGYGVFANSLSPSEVVDLLNEQQSTINELKEENKKLIEEWEFSFRTEMAHHRFAEKELQEKIREKQAKIKELEKVNEDLREVNKENQLLHEENVKQCERWKNLYDIKDAEVTARVDALNKVCEYYTSEVLFKSDVDPNKAVKEVINEILNTEVKMW